MAIQNSLLRAEVVKLLHTVPSPPGEPLPSGVPRHVLEEFEESIGIRLPEGVQSWLATCNGPCVGAGGVMGISPLRKSLDITRRLASFPEWRVRGWLPIAGDGCGNYYLVATRNEFGRGEPVFFIDTMANRELPTYLVASDIWHFLRFFLLDDLKMTRWPFDAAEVVAADPDILRFKGAPLPWES